MPDQRAERLNLYHCHTGQFDNPADHRQILFETIAEIRMEMASGYTQDLEARVDRLELIAVALVGLVVVHA